MTKTETDIGTLAYEFPDYDATTLPELPEGFEPSHWHNDACPSWVNEARNLRLFIDWPNFEDRDWEGPRYSLQTNMDEGDYSGHEIAASDSWDEILPLIKADKRPI
jgi:hypothetical protein